MYHIVLKNKALERCRIFLNHIICRVSKKISDFKSLLLILWGMAGTGGCLFLLYLLNLLKIQPKGAIKQSRVAEANSEFQYDVEATYCFLGV